MASKEGKAARPGNAQGQRMRSWQKVTLAAVLVAVLASLAFDSGIGTPSAFGVGRFFLLCPLGGLEAMLAAGSLIPVAAISAAVVLAFSCLFGRAWCAWGCPVPAVRRFFRRQPEAPKGGQGLPAAPSCAGMRQALDLRASLRHVAHDTRTWVLAGVLAAAVVAGFPLFCLACPIGLTFGTVGSLWHLIVDKQLTASVVVFPVALAVEVVAYRRWCANLCPVAGLLNIAGQLAVLFRPRIDASTCLRANGTACDCCTAVCSEDIDKHAPDAVQQLGQCTRCGECARQCPTASIVLGGVDARERP